MKLSIVVGLAVLCLTAAWAAPQTGDDQQQPSSLETVADETELDAIEDEVADETELDAVSDEADEADVSEDGLSGGHHYKPKPKEKLIEFIDKRDRKGYRFKYATNLGTVVWQVGRLVRNKCWCIGSSCGGHSCDGCHCDDKHCSGGSHCHLDECEPGSSVSRGGHPCDPGSGEPTLRGVRDGEEGEKEQQQDEEELFVLDDEVPESDANAEDIDEASDPVDEESVLSGGHDGCHGGKCKGKVIVIPKGGYKFNTPDCFHVDVTYSAGFQGYQPKVKVTKIKDCKPNYPPHDDDHHHHRKDCKRPDSKWDRYGKKCTCDNPRHVFNFFGLRCDRLDCKHPDSKFDKYGKRCNCKNPYHVYDYRGRKCRPGAVGPVEPLPAGPVEPPRPAGPVQPPRPAVQ